MSDSTLLPVLEYGEICSKFSLEAKSFLWFGLTRRKQLRWLCQSLITNTPHCLNTWIEKKGHNKFKSNKVFLKLALSSRFSICNYYIIVVWSVKFVLENRTCQFEVVLDLRIYRSTLKLLVAFAKHICSSCKNYHLYSKETRFDPRSWQWDRKPTLKIRPRLLPYTSLQFIMQ